MAQPHKQRLIKGASTACDRRRLTVRRQRRATRDPEASEAASPRSAPTEAPWSHLAEARATVGRRVRLYWGGDQKWYSGRIVLVHPSTRCCFVKYDDHDERWHAMWEEQFEWLDDGAGRPPRPPPLRA